jgi:hypothetical protein
VDGPSLTAGYPPGWFADLTGDRTCRYFGPSPFVVHPGTDSSDWAVAVERADVAAAAVVDRMRTGRAATTITETKVAGRPATRIDVVSDGAGMLPAGYEFRMYVFDAGDRAIVVTGTAAPAGEKAAANRDGADTIAGLLRTS